LSIRPQGATAAARRSPAIYLFLSVAGDQLQKFVMTAGTAIAGTRHCLYLTQRTDAQRRHHRDDCLFRDLQAAAHNATRAIAARRML
jgi:hypothetical protein